MNEEVIPIVTENDTTPSLGDAANRYITEIQSGKNGTSSQELVRLIRWFGKDQPVSALAPNDIEKYAGSISPSDKDFDNRLAQVRSFLAFVKKKGWSKTNLAVHIKVKKAKSKSSSKVLKYDAVEMTRQGYESLEREIEELKEERVRVTEEIRKAAADKDFRENAPLQAARERKGIIEGKLLELGATLNSAEIIGEHNGNGKKIGIGDCIICRDLSTGEKVRYTLVSPREVNALKGKISNVSPIGKALVGCELGEKVEVTIPAGTICYEIIDIER